MPILTIKHVTTYHYRRPVAFGEHRMMLRPRDDKDQKVFESELEITPEPSHLSWSQDTFGNHVATARFAHRASELRFESTIRLDHAPAGFGEADIEDFARHIRLLTGRKKGPAWRTSSRRRRRAPRSITGPRASSARTGPPTPATFWST
jgi:transglutaminase-like putative cysteine protease